MMHPQTLAQIVRESGVLAARYFAGFDERNCTRQAPGLPNHFSWCLGHCAAVMHRVADGVGGTPIVSMQPPSAAMEEGFKPGGSPSGGGDADRFAIESVAFGSAPVDDAAQYPGAARAVEIFNRACERCAGAFGAAPESRLEELVQWGKLSVPVGALAPRMAFHNGMHAGQLADLRRAFGFKSIFG